MEIGFLGSSGVDVLPKFPETMRDDLAGVAGLSVDDCLAGVLVTVLSSGLPLVLKGSELGRTCSGFTSGTTVAEVTFSGKFPDSLEACLTAGALLLGPRARPFVMCCNSGPGAEFSSCAGLVGDTSASALDIDLLVAKGGGPRASIPAKAGLKRPASLLDTADSFDANNGAG